MGIPGEIVREVALQYFGSTGSIRGILRLLRGVCREWRDIIDKQVVPEIARGWPPDTLMTQFVPIAKCEHTVHVSARRLWSLHVTSSNIVYLPVTSWGPALLWTGCTESWILHVFDETVGICAMHKTDKSLNRVLLPHKGDNAPWLCTRNVITDQDGWLYKEQRHDSVSRVRLQTDADVESKHLAWEHVCTFEKAIVNVLGCDNALILVLLQDMTIAKCAHKSASVVVVTLAKELSDIELVLACGSHWAALSSYGAVLLLNQQMSRVVKCLASNNCYLVRTRGTFVAVAGCFDKQDKVLIHDTASQWQWLVPVRGHLNDMQWRKTGQLLAIANNALFYVGGNYTCGTAC